MGPYSLGFCEWDVPALIVVLVVTAVIVVHNYKHSKKAEEYRIAIEELREGSKNVDKEMETE